MGFSFILLAGGESNRFKSNIPKPYHKIAGETLIEISVNKIKQFKQFKKIIIVYNKNHLRFLKKINLKNVTTICGGRTRQQSTYNALKYLNKTKKKFDLILFKQSIHFFESLEIKKILRLSKKILSPEGKIIILALHPKQNHWPLFKVFKLKLLKSLNKDEKIFNLIKSTFKKYKINYFTFKVKIARDLYLQMIKNRFNSCHLNLSSKELKNGTEEIKKKYKKKLIFSDKLICISYKKL